MKIIKSAGSYVADVIICLCFALLVAFAWPFIESSDDFKEGSK